MFWFDHKTPDHMYFLLIITLNWENMRLVVLGKNQIFDN